MRAVRFAVFVATSTAPVAVRAAVDTAPFIIFDIGDEPRRGFGGVTPVALINSLTASDSASTRSESRSTSLCVWTPSFDSARATRSSKTCSSLSQVPPAIFWTSFAFAVAAPRAAAAVSAATLRVCFSSASPCWTSVSNTFLPPACAFESAPRPAR